MAGASCSPGSAHLSPSTPTDAPGELAILLDALGALFQHSRAIIEPALPPLDPLHPPEPHQTLSGLVGGGDAVFCEEGGLMQGAMIDQAGGGMLGAGCEGGDTAAGRVEPAAAATAVAAYGQDVLKVIEGLSWGLTALHAIVTLGARHAQEQASTRQFDPEPCTLEPLIIIIILLFKTYTEM